MHVRTYLGLQQRLHLRGGRDVEVLQEAVQEGEEGGLRDVRPGDGGGEEPPSASNTT